MSTGKFAVNIGGEAVTVPGVYTVADTSAMVIARGVPERVLAIVASARGGAVGGITRVRNSDEARLLRGGLGAQMARVAFRHGSDEVLFVRADQATSAVFDLTTALLVAVNPGVGSAALQAKTAPNAERADAIDLFIKDASGAEQPETYAMIGPLVDLTYIGTGTEPSCNVSKDGEGNITVTLTATGDPTAAMKINSGAIPTISDLVEAVNRSGAWVAKAVAQPSIPLTVINGSAVAFSGNNATIKGGKELLALLLENRPSRIARLAEPAQAPTQPGTGPGGLRVTSTYEFFQGGSDGPTPTTNDYIAALRLLEGVPVTAIALGTDTPAAVAALQAHIDVASGVKARKERFGGVGIGIKTTKSESITAATTLAQTFADVDRMIVASNNPYDNDMQTGVLREMHGALLATAALAIKVNTRPEDPVTNKTLRFTKMRYTYDTEELEDLIEGGVMPCHFDQEEGRHKVVFGITTYTVDNNMASRKLAAVDAIDYLNKKVRMTVRQVSIGRVADEATVKVVLQTVKGLLAEEVRSTRNPQGILTPGIDLQTGFPVAAFRNLEAVFDGGDLIGVDFDANLVGEIAYVRVRPRFTPVRIVAR